MLNGYLYINSRGESKIRVFKIDPETGALTDETAASGDAVTGIYAGSELVADPESGILAIAFSEGSMSGLKKIKFLQQNPDTGVLTQVGTSTSSAGTSGIPDALAFAQDLSQLLISTDHSSGQLGFGSADIALGTYISEGIRGLRVGALFAYPGTNFLIASTATGGIGTYALPMQPGSTTLSFKADDLAFYFAKHPSLDVLYAAGSITGIFAYSFNTTSGALTSLNQAGGSVAISEPYADEGLAVLSNGKFAYASHYDFEPTSDGVNNTRIEFYPLNAETGAFEDGATTVDISGAGLAPEDSLRFMTIADFEVEE